MPNFFVCVLSVQIEKCKHRRLLDISSQVNFPHMLRFFCGWMAFLFTTRILVLEFLSGSLIVALRSVQPVTVDSKVKRNLNTDNSELPRPSNCLRLQWSKWNYCHPCHCNVILFFLEYLDCEWANLWTGDHTVPVSGLVRGLVITPSLHLVWVVDWWSHHPCIWCELVGGLVALGTGDHIVPVLWGFWMELVITPFLFVLSLFLPSRLCVSES